jgi:hypothetical protein
MQILLLLAAVTHHSFGSQQRLNTKYTAALASQLGFLNQKSGQAFTNNVRVHVLSEAELPRTTFNSMQEFVSQTVRNLGAGHILVLQASTNWTFLLTCSTIQELQCITRSLRILRLMDLILPADNKNGLCSSFESLNSWDR